jgi:MFS family permease
MAAGGVILGFSIAVANVLVITILQTTVPPKMQGRVTSVIVSLASITSLFGMTMSGTVARLKGTANLFARACSLSGATIIIPAWFFTDIKYAETIGELQSQSNGTQNEESDNLAG